MHWHPAYVALGSNLSDPARQVESAISALTGLAASRLVSRSSLWKSRPLGPADQPDFINAVAGLLTTETPQSFLAALKELERRLGRTQPVVRWGPRVIDLDLLVYGDRQADDQDVTVPHPGLHRRYFVVFPRAELAAVGGVPGRGRVRTLKHRAAGDGLERLGARGSGD
jgi:2-amino-4-hydroxy-6-hydroxymethyldihydropteridine diphosphokinase